MKKSSSTTGCGLFSVFFQRRKPGPRKSPSTRSLATQTNGNTNIIFPTPTRIPGGGNSSNPSSNPSQRNIINVRINNNNGWTNKSLGTASELESRGGAHIVHSSLGNLVQQGKPTHGNKELDHSTKDNRNSRYLNSGMGNIITNTNQNQNHNQKQKQKQNSNGNTPLCRALLTRRMEPEDLIIMGNEAYKNGNFAESLVPYERAVDMDPTNASYRSNKSAALTALGHLLEAVFESKEAIRIEPRYHKAHHHLANLYLRLGEPEKGLYHFRQAGKETDPNEMSKAKVVLGHLRMCNEAKRLKDWHTVFKNSGNAISAGADSAPLVLALQAEACLKLLRHEDADAAMKNNPTFNMKQCANFFGASAISSVLVIKAQVDMVMGRFDEAIESAEEAVRLDPSYREASIVSRRARVVSSARSLGNDLFRDSRFSEACTAYNEGLDYDPYNSVLLCNRAACHIELGHFKNAIEDCTSALNLRPSYTKARLRRAHSNLKLQKWELALRDYEILLQESPGDEKVYKAWFETQLQLKKHRGEDVSNVKLANEGVVKIQSNEHFRNLISWPGLSVALFANAPKDKQTVEFTEELCKRYPTVRFVKVDVEDYKGLLESEGVSSLPVLKIYRRGSRVKDVSGEDREALESSIKEYTS